MVCATDVVSYETCYGNRKITVTLEYPEQTDKKAEQEFYGRLKQRILRDISLESLQNGQQKGAPEEVHSIMAKGET